MNGLLTHALEASRAGLCVVPPRQDGSKAPEGFWKAWQSDRPDDATLREWYANGRTGIGYVCGAVSGNLELFEFEDRCTYEAFVATARALGMGDLVDRVADGYETETPGAGVHWLTRCSEVAGNTKLACRPKRPDEMQHPNDKVRVLIETRGEGGYAVEAPSNGSVHPSGGAYRLVRGDVSTIAKITLDERRQLWALARTFDEMPESMPPASSAPPGARSTGLIDDFNARTTWRELLEPDGWTLVLERGNTCYWRRPGKDRGWSAISGYSAEDRFAVYSTSTDLEAGKGYSKFGYYAHRHHGDDFKATARELGRRGYGETPNRSAPDIAPAEAAVPDEEGKPGRETAADALIRLGSAGELFCDRLGETYARIEVDGHRETWPLRSKGYRRWLVRAYYRERIKAPSSDALGAALGVLEAKAQFDAPPADVYVRVAPDGDGGLYVDLGDPQWRAVHVTAGGWEIVAHPPVRFRRSGGMQALPVPERGGTLDELRDLVNVRRGEDWALVKAWLRAALRDRGPYPIMAIVGEQGSAKSTFERMLRALVDPSRPELRSEPREQRDLAIAARACWVLAYDNLSGVQPWCSDAFCRLATGGGWATRELYTDMDEILFDAQRPIILNGIGAYMTRGDLFERTVQVQLEPIDERQRRPERELWAAFEAIRPRLVGALLDDLAGALRSLPTVRLGELPRMADFALWAVAAERGRGEVPALLAAYAGARTEAHEQTVEASTIGSALRGLLDHVGAAGWQGQPGELLAALEERASEKLKRSKAWPSSPRKLTSELQRIMPSLRSLGYTVETGKRGGHGGKRLILISQGAQEKWGEQPSPPSPPSPQPPLPDRDGVTEMVTVRMDAPAETVTTVTMDGGTSWRCRSCGSYEGHSTDGRWRCDGCGVVSEAAS